MQLKINANKLKQLRESRCWSQQQLADLSGLSLRTVQRIEAKSVASQESIKCLGAVFEIQLNELFDDAAEVDETASVSPELATEASSKPTTPVDHQTESEATAVGKSELKRLYTVLNVVIACHLFGFVGIFAAYGLNQIDEQTFKLLKNSMSITLVVSSVLCALKHRHLKKKYGLGSSLF